MLHFITTTHACKRARERLKWHARALHRMLERVYYFGVSAPDCPRALQHYLSTLPQHEGTSFVRVYGQWVFIFSREEDAKIKLLTVYGLPPGFRLNAQNALRRTRTDARFPLALAT